MPQGAEDGILKGMYLLRKSTGKKQEAHVQLLGSGTILREVMAAAELLDRDFGVAADIWSVTSFTELRREGLDVERWNRLHPEETPKVSYVQQCLAQSNGPTIASTDYMASFADQIRPFISHRYVVLGTDGYGRSDTRKQLRKHFEVDRYWVVVAALKALADGGKLPASKVTAAIKKYGIDPEKPNPLTV
jgi:pyruvate dehydrogenase E1 component